MTEKLNPDGSLEFGVPLATEDSVGHEVQPAYLYVFTVLSVFTASGGLIFGYGPFIERLVLSNVVKSSQTQIIFDNAFQVMTGFTVVWTFHLHHWGPRAVAASGALLASVGNLIIVVTLKSQSAANTVYWLLCGYGLIGGGGIGIYMASFNIAHLFPDKGFRISLITAAFCASGSVYILLFIKSIPLTLFFGIYSLYTFIMAMILMILYPSTPYDGSTSVAHICVPLKPCCVVLPLSAFRQVKDGLKKPRFWAFAVAFAWETVVCTWVQGALLERNPHASSIYKNIAFPLISNATYLTNPFVGKAVDKFGFVGLASISILVVQISIILMYFTGVVVQWLTLVFIMLMQSCTYTMEFAYLNLAFPSHMFPGLLCVTVVIQFLIDLVSVFLSSKPWGTQWTYYLMFLFGPTLLLYVFPILQYRDDMKNDARQIGRINQIDTPSGNS